MKIKVTVEDQPREFIQRQSPDTRRQLRKALRGVESGQVFPVALEDELDGFYKLKAGSFRFIIQHARGRDGPFFRVVYCERRKVVYEIFSQALGLE